MTNAGDVAARLEADRKALLDLSLRNPLLNYRSRARSLDVVGESSVALFQTLVVDGKATSFLHDPKAVEVDDEAQEEGEGPVEAAPPPAPLPIVADHGDLKLQTGLTAESLEAKLLAIYLGARSSIEEQGINTLYLALGLLRWGVEKGSKSLRAPLVLVPVSLERSGARERFRLRHDGDDPGGNLSLAEKLGAEFRIELPPFPEDEPDLTGYFDAVASCVAGRDRWEVDRDAAALGFFSFGKFLMYRDLDPEGWPDDSRPADHPIVRALLGEGFPALPPSNNEQGETTADVDIPVVLDADGSQSLAIRDVAEGRTLVIQGPPGTGKSQTIANLIAGAIADGRSVLFVAEKLAALEVVKRRLDAVGLGDACLELHSRKASKKAVLAELRRTLEIDKPRVGPVEEDRRLLEDLRGRLDAYGEAINAPVGPSGVSPRDAIGELLRMGDEVPTDDLPRPELQGLAEWSGYDYRRKLGLVEQLQARLPTVGIPDQHPFRGSRRTLFHPAERETLRERIAEARRAVEALRGTANRLAELLRLTPPGSKAEVEALLLAARKAALGLRLQGINPRDDEWSSRKAEVVDLIKAGSNLSRIRGRLGPTLLPSAWDEDVAEARRDLNLLGRRWWRFASGAYRKADRTLAGLCRGEPPKELEARLRLLDDLMESRRHRESIARLGPVGARLFGPRWQGESSRWRGLAKAFLWVTRLLADARSGKLPSGLLDFLAEPAQPGPVHEAIRATRSALEAYPDTLVRLSGFLEFAGTLDGLAFHDLERRLALWTERGDALKDLVVWNHAAEACRREGLAGVVDLAASWPGATDHLSRAFRRRWFEGLIEVASASRPSLAGFDGRGHDREIEAFRDLDRRALAHARASAAQQHWRRLPRHEGGGQLAVLRREFEKKSRYLPLRQLHERAGNAVRAIKPVFLMSPLSVATYLAPGLAPFDLVVFDEASQVRPVDALGALLRGGQAVVVGDSRQLPPTQFFDRLVGGEDLDDELEPSLADVESILGLFAAQGAPERMLRWHYRSRHESLIAVSNREFYDDRLVVFPSPDADRREAGLVLRHLPGTVYDRGGTRTNPGEAEAVAAAVMAHAAEQLRKPAEARQTLGVAAFSVAQARSIVDRLERLRRADPARESFFAEGGAEPFFVKNLENVQGDERDVIFLSLGYGRSANGSMAMAFGPLNAEGGERRLNVLMTRARARCEVFANFTSADLDLTRTQARGVRALKTFLAFAETGRFEGSVDEAEATSPPFEEAVRAAIAREGFEARVGLGSSVARLDLAVEDPSRPGRYLLGIASDGPSYRDAGPARDRDRLRPRVLESLGWRLHHAWSPDWARDPSGSLARLLQAIEGAKGPHRPEGHPPPPTAEPSLDRDVPSDSPELTEAQPAGTIPPYQIALLSVDTEGKELGEVPPLRMADWVAQVVHAEGPVHMAEVARRIAEAAGVKRIGPRIQAALEEASEVVSRRGDVRRKGDFLWPSGMTEPPIRERSGLSAASKKLEYVAPEEIGRAIERVVLDALGMEPDAIPPAAGRLLGFPRFGDDNRKRIEAIRDELVAQGRLERRGAHLVVTGPASPG